MRNSIFVPIRCGDRCRNRRFQQRKFAQLTVQECEEKGKGFGLFADQDLKKGFRYYLITIDCLKKRYCLGDFLYEYLGELISTKELNNRMQNYIKMKHLYVMQV